MAIQGPRLTDVNYLARRDPLLAPCGWCTGQGRRDLSLPDMSVIRYDMAGNKAADGEAQCSRRGQVAVSRWSLPGVVYVERRECRGYPGLSQNPESRPAFCNVVIYPLYLKTAVGVWSFSNTSLEPLARDAGSGGLHGAFMLRLEGCDARITTD